MNCNPVIDFNDHSNKEDVCDFFSKVKLSGSMNNVQLLESWVCSRHLTHQSRFSKFTR